jgi:hypothetical protein
LPSRTRTVGVKRQAQQHAKHHRGLDDGKQGNANIAGRDGGCIEATDDNIVITGDLQRDEYPGRIGHRFGQQTVADEPRADGDDDPCRDQRRHDRDEITAARPGERAQQRHRHPQAERQHDPSGTAQNKRQEPEQPRPADDLADCRLKPAFGEFSGQYGEQHQGQDDANLDEGPGPKHEIGEPAEEFFCGREQR